MKLSFCKRCAPSQCESDQKPCHKKNQLIYGPVYMNCEHLKTNGLQHECKRARCMYNPDCDRGKVPRIQNRNSSRLVCCKNVTGL